MEIKASRRSLKASRFAFHRSGPLDMTMLQRSMRLVVFLQANPLYGND
jgi:hypothetical protein